MIRFLLRMSGPLMAALVLAAVVRVEGPAAAAGGNAAAGAALAELWCATCHVVKYNQTQGQSDAPSFPSIARRAIDPSPEWIAFTLLAPHPLMPEVSLTQAQARELSAYFKTLEKERD
ncbi:c-type cytochrome [Xanthobacter sediminis]